jgi:hypothetical protein
MAIQIPATGHGPQVTMKEYIPRVPHLLCSVFPRPFFFHDANGQYELPGCKGTEPTGCSSVSIQPGYDKYDLGEDKHISALSIPAKEIAKDYAGLLTGTTMFTDRGVFVPEGDAPTKEEVNAARKRLEAWAKDTVGKADRMWAQTQKITDISDDAKLAANCLSIERTWAQDWDPVEKIACPACGEPMNLGAKIHSIGQKGCGQRINYDDAGKPFWADEKRAVAPPTK